MPSKYYNNNIAQVQPLSEQEWGETVWGDARTLTWTNFGMLPSWRGTFTTAELNDQTKNKTWMEIRPAYPVPKQAHGAVFAHIKYYDSAFENTIWSLKPLHALGALFERAGGTGPAKNPLAKTAPTAGELADLLKNTEKYFQDLGRGSGDTGLPIQLVYLLGKKDTDSRWAMDTARAWAKAYRFATSEENPEAISDSLKYVYEFYGKLWGIPFKALPTGPSSFLNAVYKPSTVEAVASTLFSGGLYVNTKALLTYLNSHGWGDIFGPWSDPDTQNMDSFQDVLLYLYLKPENDRRARAASLAEDLSKANTANFAANRVGGAAAPLRTRALTRINEKVNANKSLSKRERRALKAIGDKNDNYFRNISRQSTQCILRMNLASYTTAHALNPQSLVINKDGSIGYIEVNKQPYFLKDRYDSSIYLDYGNSATLVNKLTFSPYGDKFLNIRTDEISQLMPMIRIYKSAHEDGKLISETEFKFEGGPGADPLEDRPGVGIKSFDWTLNATNPATIRNDIEAKLVLYFQDFAELKKQRTGWDVISGKQKGFKYQDLLIRPPVTGITTLKLSESTKSNKSISEQCREKQDNTIDQKFYEIKALVGWADPGTMDIQSGDLLRALKLKKSIKNQQLSMFLNLIDHSFNLTQEGTFELEITYRGRLAALATDPRMDVLTTPDQKTEIDKLLVEIEEAQKNCESQSDIDSYNEEISRIREVDRDALGSAILSGLSDRIYTTKIDQKEFNLLTVTQAEEKPYLGAQNPFIISPEMVVNSINEKDKTLVEAALNASEARLVDSRSPSHPDYDAEAEKKALEDSGSALELGYLTGGDNIHIPWFYFGDLVDVVVRHLMVDATAKENAKGVVPTIEMESLSFLFGNVPVQELGYSADGRGQVLGVYPVNIADVPITLEMFNAWYIKKVITPDRQTYSILEFLRDICDDLVRATLNRNCFDGNLAHYWTTAAKGQGPQHKLTPLGGSIIVDQTAFYEIPDLIFKTTSVSLPSQKTSTEKATDLDMLGKNPLEKFQITLPEVGRVAEPQDEMATYYTSVKTNSTQYPAAWINSDLFVPPADNDNHNLVSRKENSHDQTIKNSYHLMVFYFINDDSYRKFGPPQNGLTRYERDLNEGVFHLILGKDSGIFKSVQFSKTDAPFLREARIQQAQLDPLSQLAATYDVTLKLIGNTLFWPGQYIFINPIGFGTGLGRPDDVESISNALGLGGYHLVTGVKNYIEEGKYETEVKARFEFSGDGCPSLPGSTTQPCED